MEREITDAVRQGGVDFVTRGLAVSKGCKLAFVDNQGFNIEVVR